jgi:hypothetical protein
MIQVLPEELEKMCQLWGKQTDKQLHKMQLLTKDQYKANEAK